VNHNRPFALFAAALVAGSANAQSAQGREPNEHGRVPILEYHLIADKDSRWGRSAVHFRHDLQLLYDRGYRPITVAQLVDKQIDIPPGTSPVVFTFDDASPGQFRYVEKNGALEIDPNSAVGIWLDFNSKHPDWGKRATFCLLSGAAAGHAFFGDKGIEGQKSEWRFKKVRFLAEQGFELCGHTLWHANLAKYSDAVVQEQIARGVLAIDSAVTGYRVRTFALPLGIWPKNRALASAGVWHDSKTGREVRYAFDAILEVSGPSAPSPRSSQFNPRSLPRIQLFGSALETTLDQLEKQRDRYVPAESSRKTRVGGAK
jgi:peptidoglycan/xylan/chitin deacetylase (PgdA/CDA1 family)